MGFIVDPNHSSRCVWAHTIRKRKKMAVPNPIQILLLNDANMIEEH